jgi:hypothetical protein
MQPLKLLNNVQKARLLHSLLATEMPDFLSYCYEYTEKVLDAKEELKANWKDQLFGADFWLELAEDCKRKAEKYKKELTRSSSVFADQLFDGYAAIYTTHVLLQYAEAEGTDRKFKQAVELLFA